METIVIEVDELSPGGRGLRRGRIRGLPRVTGRFGGGMMNMLVILISQMYAYAKDYQIIYFKYVPFIIWQLHHHIAVNTHTQERKE